ncbi:uncharacterized protein LODBEIA_P44880 [Lodderomyces beijingensis]|uniref:Uncharacterized protein n=1 Tax=Lodderomyces beijingensis TaxID=1775926 RepID=A0ABP0ZQS2_9ASCO
MMDSLQSLKSILAGLDTKSAKIKAYGLDKVDLESYVDVAEIPNPASYTSAPDLVAKNGQVFKFKQMPDSALENGNGEYGTLLSDVSTDTDVILTSETNAFQVDISTNWSFATQASASSMSSGARDARGIHLFSDDVFDAYSPPTIIDSEDKNI